MPIEIERKFLVNKEAWLSVTKDGGKFYQQGYLLTQPGKTVRVRLGGDKGFITIKGNSSNLSRPEYEYEIPAQDAKELLENFCSSIITKTRYHINHDGKLWEVDHFMGDNEGLLMAEIELQSEDENFSLPPWTHEEVTGDIRYYNSYLSLHPYKNW